MCKTNNKSHHTSALPFSDEQIRILSFNVENLSPKLDEPDFIKMIEDHEICLFTETWLKTDEK